MSAPADVLDFWWNAGAEKWFAGGEAFDREIRERFGDAWRAASEGALDDWAETADGALALIVVLDQFSRNLHRDDPAAFSQDGKGVALAEAAIAKGFDRAYPPAARVFFYLPFMHSEAMADQERSVDLFRRLGDRENYFYALVHMDAIRRFGRFPHRNAVLGRKTTEAEAAYLASGGFSA